MLYHQETQRMKVWSSEAKTVPPKYFSQPLCALDGRLSVLFNTGLHVAEQEVNDRKY